MYKYFISLFCFIFLGLTSESFGSPGISLDSDIERISQIRPFPSAPLPDPDSFQGSVKRTARGKLLEYLNYGSYLLWYRAAYLTVGLAFPWIPTYGLELLSIGAACLAPHDPLGLSPVVDNGVNTAFQYPILKQGLEAMDNFSLGSLSLASSLWSRASRAFW